MLLERFGEAGVAVGEREQVGPRLRRPGLVGGAPFLLGPAREILVIRFQSATLPRRSD